MIGVDSPSPPMTASARGRCIALPAPMPSASGSNPNSAFTLNNRGFVAEQDGDLETAQYFYGKAQRAENAGGNVGFATQLAAEGQSLETVAGTSNDKVDDALEVYSQKRRQEQAPIELTPRGGSSNSSPENEPKTPPSPATQPQLQTRPQF